MLPSPTETSAVLLSPLIVNKVPDASSWTEGLTIELAAFSFGETTIAEDPGATATNIDC